MSTRTPWNLEPKKTDIAKNLEDLSDELGVSIDRIKGALKTIKHSKPERVQVPRVAPSGKQIIKHVPTYAAEDVEKIRRHFLLEIQDREGSGINASYIPRSKLRKELEISEGAFEYYLSRVLNKENNDPISHSPFLKNEPDGFEAQIKRIKGVEFYSPKISELIEELLTKEKYLRESEQGRYFTLTQVIRTLNLSNDTLARKKIKEDLELLLQANPHLEAGKVERAPIIGSSPVTHYSKQVIELLQKKIEDETRENASDLEKMIPSGYLSRREISKKLEVDSKRASTLLTNSIDANPELTNPVVKIYKKQKGSTGYSYYYSPEIVEKLITYINQAEQRKEQKRLERLARYLDIGSSRKDNYPGVDKLLTQGRRDKDDFFSAYQLIQQDKQRKFEEDRKKQEELKQKITSFFEEVEQSSTLEASDFRKLVLVFGSSHLIDLLFQFHPEFEAVPLSFIKNETAKFLGDFLMVRSVDFMDNLELALPFLNKESYRESLFLLIKESGIKYYSTEKKKEKIRNDDSIIQEFLDKVHKKQNSLTNNDLNTVIAQVEEYFNALLYGFTKPESVIDQLESGRPFPDLNQRINIKETQDQNRILIADEMGMGKSASAILAKEYLKVGAALVVVPNNVIDTWKRYLSDAVGPQGKQLGYFKQGQAPRVLEVTRLDELEGTSSEDYDYVLISQERLNDEFAQELKDKKFGMFIVDEVHKFKNISQGKRSQALVEFLTDLEKLDTYTILLSGTPVPNKIKDIAIIIKLLYPEEYKDTTNKELVKSIVNGDFIDLRNLLFKRMQMKKLAENIEMPAKTEITSEVTLSDTESVVYQLILEDDSLYASEKLHILRLFCLRPETAITEGAGVSSKVQKTSEDLQEIFRTKNRVIFFVNGYIEGVTRGDKTIQQQLDLPTDVQVLVIDGNVEREKRKQIENELRHNKHGKMLLIVSGQTADVGVDFSEAESVYFYNEPWTKYDKMQQMARTYRPGLKHDLEVRTSITKDTIEEGIHEYIEIKFNAVQKLLQGIPLSDLEKMVITLDERAQSENSYDDNPTLADEWLQSPVNKLRRFFNATKEIGADNFIKYLQEHGKEYAENYEKLSSTGYQANIARLVSALIREYRKEKRISSDDPMTILDLGSGPEVLSRHIREKDKKNVISIDINQHHFTQGTGTQVVGNITSLPIRDASADYVNLSLVFHYLQAPGKDNIERLKAITEIARVLKVGGRCSIPMISSFEFKNKRMLRGLLQLCGLEIIEDKSGIFTHKQNFRSECVTFEKFQEVDLENLHKELKIRKYLLDGLNLRKVTAIKTRNDQLVANTFSLHREKIQAELNTDDTLLLAEQEEILDEGKLLIKQYGTVQAIPPQEILKKEFVRYYNGKRYKLVKKSKITNTFITIDNQNPSSRTGGYGRNV